MKKYLPLSIVALLLISGFGAIAGVHNNGNFEVRTDTCSFSALQILENTNDIQIQLPEATSSISTSEGYRIPVVTQVYTFPFKTTIQEVSVGFSGITEQIVIKPLQLAPHPIADTTDAPIIPLTRTLPENDHGLSYSYHVATGRDGNEVVTILAVQLYPVQYHPSTKSVLSARNAQITIHFTLSGTKPASTEDYDLLILAPQKFANALQPLVDHKISKGITTKLVTMEEICDGTYFPTQGRDCAEEMKYFIKNAFDQWGTTYVLLVGGRKGGILKETWWIPPRYSRLNDGSEGSYLTDLYFADLYDGNGSFSSWDSDNNGVFAEWSSQGKDTLDMYPEVYVGRLPCTSVAQVRTMVNKIITYETTTNGSEWFNTFIGVAGDTYPDVNDPYYEGEMATNASFAQLQDLGFTSDMMWTSNGRFTGPDPVIAEISKGCGFVHFSGHGNPKTWANHPPQNETFINGPNAFEMKELTNGDKQPIVIVGGCHNAQFNTSVLNLIKGILKEGLRYFAWKMSLGRFWYNEWIPQCWAWAMDIQAKGGAIGVIANSGLGYGEPGANTLTERGRHLEWLFFKAYHDDIDGKRYLGETHAADLMYYMNVHPPMDDQVDCKIVQEWVLLGDPSLLIGGYPT
jgi:Peptidase family C25